MQKFGELLLNTLSVERVLHHSYGEQFDFTPEQMAATQMAPTNYAYTRHLLHIAATGSLPELVTSILPWAWICAEVGRHFQARSLTTEEHAYRDWLLTYASPDFEEVGAWLRGVPDDRAARLDEPHLGRLEEIFLTSSWYEWMFWDLTSGSWAWVSRLTAVPDLYSRSPREYEWAVSRGNGSERVKGYCQFRWAVHVLSRDPDDGRADVGPSLHGRPAQHLVGTYMHSG